MQAKGITKRYGGVTALEEIDLTLRSGEWLGLLGPNGAGKTTLMKLLIGLLQPDAGQFMLMGQAINPGSSRVISQMVGFVPQEVALYADLTAAENLNVFARLHGLRGRAIQPRVAWALEWTGLAERQACRVGALSGGMKRRLNIACGVLHEPKIVLLDEPTVGVDPIARQKIWSMLDGLRAAGTSLIHSSHQLDEIEATCDRVIIIDRTKIAEGKVQEMLHGANRKTRRLTLRLSGSPPAHVFGKEFAIHGTLLTGASAEPARRLREVMIKAESLGLEILEMHVEQPRLEDLFTELTADRTESYG